MKEYDSLLIGHISLDNNVDCDGTGRVVPGGAVVYGSAAAHMLGFSVGVVTKLARKDADRLGEFVIPRDDLYVTYSDSSTEMKNVYLTPDKDRRISSCSSRSDPFVPADIPEDVSAKICHLAGLIYGDLPIETIRYAATLPSKTALDVQALLRHAAPDGSLYFEDWEYKKEIFPSIDYLKTDAAEAEILTGTDDRREAARLMNSWGAKEVMVSHNDEIIIYDGESFYDCPIRSRSLAGRTGRGDTVFSVYICARQYHDIPASLLLATAAVSLKMEKPGAFDKTRAELDEYIRELYPDYAEVI